MDKNSEVLVGDYSLDEILGYFFTGVFHEKHRLRNVMEYILRQTWCGPHVKLLGITSCVNFVTFPHLFPGVKYIYILLNSPLVIFPVV